MFPAFMVPTEVKGTETAAPGQNGEPEINPVATVVISPSVNALNVEMSADVTDPEEALPVVDVLPAFVHEAPFQPATHNPLKSGNDSSPEKGMVSVPFALPDFESV